MFGNLKRILCLALAVAAVLLPPAKPARADLTITPVRVVFEGRNRTAVVNLLNLTNTTNTYRLQWMVHKLDSAGKRYHLVPDTNDKDPHSIANMVIFTPRQVTIEPHGQQLVRLSLRRPADLPPGEYRAQMAMVRLAKQGPERRDPKKDKDVSMEVKVSVGFSIPIIVRSGEDKNLTVALTAPKLAMSKDAKPELQLDIVRTAGKFSTYGTVEVYWQPSGGKEQKMGSMNNVALYPEVSSRHLIIAMKENPTGGQIRVVYKGKYESEGRIWAEKTFPIGK